MVGRNGVGKTNLLESLHVVTQGFSPRTRQDAQLIRFGETAGRVAVAGHARTPRGRDQRDVAPGAGEGGAAERRPPAVGRVAAPRGLDARLHARPAGGRQRRTRRATRLLRPRARHGSFPPAPRSAGLRRHARPAKRVLAPRAVRPGARRVARAMDGTHRRARRRRSSTGGARRLRSSRRASPRVRTSSACRPRDWAMTRSPRLPPLSRRGFRVISNVERPGSAHTWTTS